jgi:ribose/xylose/arabinose/galactoside ABC-type transport system permease subunit
MRERKRETNTATVKFTKENVVRFLQRYGNVTSLAAVVILGILLTFKWPTLPLDREDLPLFLWPENLSNILRQVSIKGILAVGMTLVILSAGIDLSVGSLLAFSCTFFALVVTGLTEADSWGGGTFLSSPALAVLVAVLLAVAGSLAMGFVNGFVVAKGRIQPFIVTLAMMLSARGIAKIISGGAVVKFYDTPDSIRWFVEKILADKWFSITVFLAIVAVFAFILRKTRFGRYTIAIGANETAARLSGVRVDRIKIWVYSIGGLLCGIAGILQCGRSVQGDPTVGIAYELDAIAAVVVGGTNLMGGRGSILGTLIGALVIQVISNVMDLRGIGDEMQLILKGAIIIVAVWLQRKK